MASGQSKVSRSSWVGRELRHARNSRRRAAFATAVDDRRGQRSQRAVTGCLRRALDEGNFLGCEVVEFIHQLIYLPVGGGDGVLERGLFRLRRGRAQLGHQPKELVHQTHQLVVPRFVGGFLEIETNNRQLTEILLRASNPTAPKDIHDLTNKQKRK